jgi:hypothetical protein
MVIPQDKFAQLIRYVKEWQDRLAGNPPPEDRIAPHPKDGLENAVGWWLTVNRIRLADLEDTLDHLTPSKN